MTLVVVLAVCNVLRCSKVTRLVFVSATSPVAWLGSGSDPRGHRCARVEGRLYRRDGACHRGRYDLCYHVTDGLFECRSV